MSVTDKLAAPAIGFLTVVDQAELGFVGGYLVVNGGGRPLEFHCTAPVKASRTQEILYGKTLRSYLYGEQIAPALVARAKVEPMVVLIDDGALLSLRDGANFPVAMLLRDDHVPTSDMPLQSFLLGETRVAVEARYSDDMPRLLALWQQHGLGLDVREPFERVQAALEEAQKSFRPAA